MKAITYTAAAIRGDGELDSEFTVHGPIRATAAEAQADYEADPHQYDRAYAIGRDGYLYVEAADAEATTERAA